MEGLWTCGNCHEVLEGQFDACWKCGCARDGRLNLNFVAVPQSIESSVDEEFAKSYVCNRCQHRDAQVERIATRGTDFASILRKDFLAVSCRNCGSTEFYNLSVLEGRTDLQNFFRGLFGA